MRITYLISNLFSGDGVGNSIVELCRLLAARGDDVQVLYENVAQPPDDFPVTLTRVSYEQLRNGTGPVEIRQALRHWRDSELVLYDYAVYYPLARALELPGQGTKVFVYHGVTPPHLWRESLGRKAVERGMEYRKLARQADYAVAASPFTAGELVELGVSPERVFVLPYAVRAERFHPRPRDEALRDIWGLHGHFVMLFLGRMASNKRIDTLVRGLAAARRRGLPVKLLLLGEKNSDYYVSEVTRAEALAEALGVREHVVFTGAVSDEALPRYFSVADVYVSGSEHEGFGIPLVEAMACGKPVVAARATAVPQVVDDGGWFFPPGDAEGLGQNVATLLGSVLDAPLAPATPPRLCFVCPRYGEGFAGGAETLCRRWAEVCHQAGWTVNVVSTTTDDMIDWSNHFAPGDAVVNGVPVKRFAVDRSTLREHRRLQGPVQQQADVSVDQQRRWLATGIGRPELFRWLAEHRNDFDFFVFLPYLSNTTLLGVEAVSEKAVVIPCLHDESLAYTAVVRSALEAAQAVFFNSPGERDFALKTLRLVNPNCFTLGLGMDEKAPGDPDAFRRKYGVSGDFFLYCGRLEEGKNVPLLLEYFARYQAERASPPALVLLGTGSVPVVRPNIQALGFVSEEDKRGAMAAATALINPSVNESLSIVLLESWREGRPVVVNGRCAVTRDLVRQSGGGLWFDNQAQFAATLDLLANDSALAARLGAQGRQHVHSHYVWPVLLQRFRERLDLLRSASAYEKLAVRALARSRVFDHHRYVERWEKFLAGIRSQKSEVRGQTPEVRHLAAELARRGTSAEQAVGTARRLNRILTTHGRPS